MMRQALLPTRAPVQRPPPIPVEELVERLYQADLAAKIDKRLTHFEELRRQHRDRRGQIRDASLGAVALVLGLSFGALNLPRSCERGNYDWLRCGQASASLASALIFLGLAVHNFRKLCRHRVRYYEFVADRDAEFARLAQRKQREELAVDQVFSRLDQYSRQELRAFKERLHAHTSQPGAGAIGPAALLGAEIGAPVGPPALRPRMSAEEEQPLRYEEYYGE